MLIRTLALALLLACGSTFAQVSQINISQDLVQLGIASQNAVPDNPGLDARPLLQAAIKYAIGNGVGKIIADPGAYWLLTPGNSYRYVVINQATDLTIDFQGSDIYLQNPFLLGFDVESCQRVTLANFTIDYVQLPFTQVRLNGVSDRTLTYDLIDGWPSPTTLRSKFGGTEYWGMVLRGGIPPANTGRLPLAIPSDEGLLQVNVEHSPWTQPSVLSVYQPGDIVVVSLKDGYSPIFVESSDTVVLSGIDVYSSGTIGVHLDATQNSTVSRVRVMPRPGTDRLISTNADGIHLSYVQSNNLVQFNHVSRTMDDAIALNSPYVAFVSKMQNSRKLTVTRNFQTRVPNGTMLSFINSNTGATLGPYQLIGQNPAYEAASTFDTSATYTFDRDLPAVQSSFGLVFADPANRGQFSVVEKNLVEDILFARGIFLAGVSGVTVQKNTIRRTNCGAIVGHQELSAFPTAANDNIQISGNTVDSAIGPAAVGTSTLAALGSIFFLATDSSYIQLPNPTATNITITNNFITNAGRSGIWAGNIDGGTIQGNRFAGFNLYPQLALWGITQAFASQVTRDFTQAIALRVSRNVSTQKVQ